MSDKYAKLRKELLFYKYYHHNRINVLIHSIFVPTILFSACCFLNRIELFKGITVTNLFSIGYTLYYIHLYLPTGLLAGLIFIIVNIGLKKRWIHLSLPTEITLFIIGWLVQFIGHGVFERRKPAVLDNLIQSLVLAPYFILFEFLFKLGFLPEVRSKLEEELKNIERKK
ncbi:2-hydroxy-palmitic acid dioxygenase MPO1 NDAI_0D03570 [Naumovozyma dairenensis CBS 421]|uniref:DUF962 domain-containing protein n=1 Tax=Naumovozyma dairenensis (strain ATCC 10597 / BCRC 20456 / CBS 421 / NBRC 0211 / NRRL Y-12639) TaxID=1071378 RepID=G0WA60_NAUDC|nr:hypothetical protein NDAI_0D03570 [Naumovozyma dairenensis CBS 421]CCD24671.1 hypothetical protein NDAI_0D03570 [Naumovozyma dairenensis CBS 421]